MNIISHMSYLHFTATDLGGVQGAHASPKF